MNKYAALCIIIYALTEIQIVCRTVCLQDGDEIGIVLNKKDCYCANKRDVSKVILRVHALPPQKKQTFWFDL